MGFFSWKTQDSHRSITNRYCEYHNTFRVIMCDDKGNQWVEDNYEGYGEFGGKDYYELLAEMNGKKTREEGLELEFTNNNKNVMFPSLSECGDYSYNGKAPEYCEFQGYFYPDEDDDDLGGFDYYDVEDEVYEEE